MLLEPNSTPTVGSLSVLNLESRNWRSKHDLPTPFVDIIGTCVTDYDVLEEVSVFVHVKKGKGKLLFSIAILIKVI